MTANPQEQPPTRLSEWTPEAADRMARQHMAGGWLRTLPTVGVQILGAVASLGRSVTPEELEAVLPVEPVGNDRWAASCWYGVGDDAARSAALDRYAAVHLDRPVRTCADLLDLLTRAGVLWREGGRIGPTAPVPGVDEVFPISNAERAEIAHLRATAARFG